MSGIFVKESRVLDSSRVFPTDLNNHGTLFGGKMLAAMDLIASISATKHSRMECVTASMDSVEFLCPVRESDCIFYESFVILTGTSSMEVFVRATAEDLLSGEKRVAATCFVTFVALKDGKPHKVKEVVPETEEEIKLQQIAYKRLESRQLRKKLSNELALIWKE
ncbi:acyl-CoA thioesterase [Gottfriedia luciferensis]|uniref:acyl-CoA thioesterase n=1 Tax=Gottfriedia luciferensis TaxID=178774 RepID=UPI000B453A64|nr:acyl-CoA thioesterase [Gottfriedia luciferensis]